MGSPLIRRLASATLFAPIVIALATGGQGPLAETDLFLSLVIALVVVAALGRGWTQTRALRSGARAR